MSDEKGKKALKLKTFDEIQNDAAYEINFFPRKRRAQLVTKKSLSIDDDEDNQVRIYNFRYFLSFFKIFSYILNDNFLFEGCYRFRQWR